MKILLVNAVYNEGSTGKICKYIHDLCVKADMECQTICSYKTNATIDEECVYVSSWLDTHIHNRLYRTTWLQGCFSYFHTLFCIRKIKKYDPDIIHLHVIHGSYINHSLLFKFIRKEHKKVVWTFHDCWAFTGYCPYYVISRCNKWTDSCGNCALFPSERLNLFDTSNLMFEKKKKWYGNGLDMTIATPSKWLSDQVQYSFLKDYPVKVIHNGIDLDVFKPVNSAFRKEHNIPKHKKIVLGVAFGWGQRKGLDVFVELAKTLIDSDYTIVLVGTTDEIDKIIPENILSVHRTNNQQELAMIYSAADVFVNPTREENYPTVNMEALACGTPVITFKTGGSPEIIDDSTGIVVDCDDVDELKKAIIHVCKDKPFSKEACVRRAKQFDMWDRYEDYLSLYQSI